MGADVLKLHLKGEAAANARLSFASVKESSSRDHFGFLIPILSLTDKAQLLLEPSGFDYTNWKDRSVPRNVECSRFSLDSLRRKYHELLLDSGLKNLVRHGIPTYVRATMWHFLSGGYELQVYAPTTEDALFHTLCSCIDDKIDGDTIESVEQGTANMASHFQTNAILKTGKGSEALCDIMYAAIQHCPGLAYSHGLHQQAAFMLVVVGMYRIEHAFWSLVAFLQTKLYPAVHGQVTLGSYVENGVLELIVQKKMPRLSKHLVKKGWSLGEFTSGWYSSAFTAFLLPEVTARVWDVIMTEGVKAMHRVSLVLLMRHESIILRAESTRAACQDLDLQLLSITDKDTLLKDAFSKVGSFSGSMLMEYRQQVMTGSAYCKFKELHATDKALRFAPSPQFTSVLSSAVGGWGGGTVQRLSYCSDTGENMYTSMLMGKPSQAPSFHRESNFVRASSDAGITCRNDDFTCKSSCAAAGVVSEPEYAVKTEEVRKYRKKKTVRFTVP